MSDTIKPKRAPGHTVSRVACILAVPGCLFGGFAILGMGLSGYAIARSKGEYGKESLAFCAGAFLVYLVLWIMIRY